MDRWRWFYPRLDQACSVLCPNGDTYALLSAPCPAHASAGNLVSPFELQAYLAETLGMPADHLALSVADPHETTSRVLMSEGKRRSGVAGEGEEPGPSGREDTMCVEHCSL